MIEIINNFKNYKISVNSQMSTTITQSTKGTHYRKEGFNRRPQTRREAEQRPTREDDVVRVSSKRPATFYVFLVKQLFHSDKFDTIEIHGAGDKGINTLSKAVGILTKYHYATITRIKTKTLSGRDSKVGKLIMHLAKSPDFEDVYQGFEAIRNEKRAEEAGKKPSKEEGDEEKSPQKVSTPDKAGSKSISSANETSPLDCSKQD